MGTMDSSNAVLVVDGSRAEMLVGAAQAEDTGPPAILRGTARGLEMVVDGRAAVDAIAAALLKRLDEAPNFFRGSDVRVTVEDGPLAPGCLARLDDLAIRFGLRIIEVAASDRDAVPKPNLAAGSAPSASGFDEEFEEEEHTNTAAAAFVEIPVSAPILPAGPVMLAQSELTELVASVGESEPISFEEPTQTAIPLTLARTAESELETATTETRHVVGPVRSGVILDHAGHLIVFGDVNPGAEIRATGNIIVLGRLRGTAHAGIGQDVGFILSLRLEPQQLRIGRMVARAADSDTPTSEAEIAYCGGGSIVVERYQGKLPRNLATSI
ncbi:MAG: septum site-determining protein MinC [Myxococcales bacterium]|nr:septum site-determining protein MinC [Myxococcales bacterium]